jgi:hypothetical protein
MNLLSRGLLPKEALPDLLRLIRLFNMALDEEMERFELDGNAPEFEAAFNDLSKDLFAFINNFEAWKFHTNTKKEHIQLQSLSRSIDEAKFLVAKAAHLTARVH